MKELNGCVKDIMLALALIVAGLVISSANADAAQIVDQNDHLVCQNCYAGKNVLLGNADESYIYNQIVETPNFAFIKEDQGSSCYGGGWNIVDKRVPNPEMVPIDTDCKEITKATAFESKGTVFFKVTYYGGKSVVYEYKM